MAQSSVSQHILSLETALGTPLFNRSAQGVQPTKAGEMLYDYAQRILQLLSEAEREIMQVQPHQLAVCATPGISVYLLPLWLQRFQAVYPAFSLSLQTELTSQVVNGVLNHKYDLGFLEGELAELDQAQLGKFRLYDVEYVVVVGARHSWVGRERIPIQALASQPFINRQPGSRARRWLETVLEVRLRNVAELDSPGAIKYALLNEMGIAILPRYAIEREAERHEVFWLRLEEFDLSRPLVMVWNRQEPFNAAQRAFINSLATDTPQLQVLL